METAVIRELDSVVLTCDVPEHGFKRGDAGTVVLVHARKGYSFEKDSGHFLDPCRTPSTLMVSEPMTL